MRVSIKALRYFLVACEQESIARAAELLNVVPSAISGLCAIPFAEETQSLRLVIGHTGGKQRRLLEVFTEACRSYFATEQAKQFVVAQPH